VPETGRYFRPWYGQGAEIDGSQDTDQAKAHKQKDIKAEGCRYFEARHKDLF
jgi:hypothetical protein